MPTIDDYYEPWTYDYQDLFNAPEGTISRRRGRSRWSPASLMEIEAGPELG